MVEIQKAKVEEAEEIRELLGKTWHDAYSHVYTPEDIEKIRSEWHTIELITKQIKDPKALFLVVKEGSKIVAMCNTGQVNNEFVNIQRLHVLPSHQRQGLGSKLLDEVVESFPNIHTLQLETEKENKKALNFYEKQGFKIVGEKVFVVAGVKMPSYVLEKTI